MKRSYLIPSRHGLLDIIFRDKGTCECRYLLASGKVLVSRKRIGMGQLLLPFTEIAEAENYLERAEETVSRIQKKVAALPLRKKMMLEFCIKGGRYSTELFEGNPALAMLMALRVHNDPAISTQEQLTHLAGKKRKQILAYCLWPNGKWVEKLLRKIPLVQVNPRILTEVRELLKENNPGKISILRHLGLINQLVVTVLHNRAFAALVSRNFYENIARTPRPDPEGNAEYLLGEICRISDETDLPRLPKIHTIEDITRIHNHVAEQYVADNCARLAALKFSPPPLPGITSNPKSGHGMAILPLRSGMELYREGREMHHCIASFAEQIANSRQLYAYHVDTVAGEKATFMIAGEEAAWRLLEIRGRCNRDVSPALLAGVEEWLAEHNKRLRDLYDRNKT